jgi:hypothetical protein
LWGDGRDKDTKSTEHALTCVSPPRMLLMGLFVSMEWEMGRLGSRARRKSCDDVRAAKDAGTQW